MPETGATEILFECFWPGVTEADLLALDERAAMTAASHAGQGERVSYLGSLFMVEDEVVLCRFAGSETAARRTAEAAGIPFARVVTGTRRVGFERSE
jgi:hypothetical protein